MYILDGVLDEKHMYLDSCLSNDKLLVLRIDTDTYKISAVLADVKSNKILAQRELEGESGENNPWKAGEAGDGFYIMGSFPYKLYIYDGQLNQTDEAD